MSIRGGPRSRDLHKLRGLHKINRRTYWVKRALGLLLGCVLLFAVIAAQPAGAASSGVTPIGGGAAHPGPTWPHSGYTPVRMTYSVGNGNDVNAYYDSGLTDLPWLVIVHGGYWNMGTGAGPTIAADCRHEQARQVACFGIDYRLVPGVHWPTPLLDVKSAVTWIRAHSADFGLDPDKGF